MKKILNKKSIFIILILIFISSFTISCSQDKRPLAECYAWKAVKDDVEINLIGTVHPVKNDYNLLNEKIIQALNNTDILSVEIDLENSENIKYLSESQLLQQGDSIENYFNADEIIKLKSIYDQLGVDSELIYKLTPQSAVNMIIAKIYIQSGFNGDSLDSLLRNEARSKKITINELEGVKVQKETMDDVYNLDECKKVLTEFNENTINETYTSSNELYNAYVKGDTTVPILQIDKMKRDQRVYDILIKSRNLTMANKIIELSKDGKKHTIAVGFMHYFGDDSILAILEQNGFEIIKL